MGGQELPVNAAPVPSEKPKRPLRLWAFRRWSAPHRTLPLAAAGDRRGRCRCQPRFAARAHTRL